MANFVPIIIISSVCILSVIVVIIFSLIKNSENGSSKRDAESTVPEGCQVIISETDNKQLLYEKSGYSGLDDGEVIARALFAQPSNAPYSNRVPHPLRATEPAGGARDTQNSGATMRTHEVQSNRTEGHSNGGRGRIVENIIQTVQNIREEEEDDLGWLNGQPETEARDEHEKAHHARVIYPPMEYTAPSPSVPMSNNFTTTPTAPAPSPDPSEQISPDLNPQFQSDGEEQEVSRGQEGQTISPGFTPRELPHAFEGAVPPYFHQEFQLQMPSHDADYLGEELLEDEYITELNYEQEAELHVCQIMAPVYRVKVISLCSYSDGIYVLVDEHTIEVYDQKNFNRFISEEGSYKKKVIYSDVALTHIFNYSTNIHGLSRSGHLYSLDMKTLKKKEWSWVKHFENVVDVCISPDREKIWIQYQDFGCIYNQNFVVLKKVNFSREFRLRISSDRREVCYDHTHNTCRIGGDEYQNVYDVIFTYDGYVRILNWPGRFCDADYEIYHCTGSQR